MCLCWVVRCLVLQEISFNDVSNENNEDSSDSEAVYESDSDAELSFESDDEGNFQPNPLKQRTVVDQGDHGDSDSGEDDVEGADSDDDAADDEEDEFEDGEEEEDVEDIDDEAESDEEDVESDDGASESDGTDEQTAPVKQTPLENGTTSSAKPKKSVQPKTNGVGAANDVKPKKEVGQLLRVKPSTSDSPNAAEAFKNELNTADKKPGKVAEEQDEYAHDSSDEEDIRNTVGNIPMEWYDEYKHIGYDWDAKQIIKPAKRDQLDDFLKRMEDPNFWRTVKDPQTGQDVILSEADIELIKRINAKRIPDGNYEEYAVSDPSFAIRY